MNLAFGALLLAILLLPGIVFRYAYLRSNALRKSVDFSLLSEAVFILLPCLLLHLLGWGFDTLVERSLAFDVLYALLSGAGLSAEGIEALQRGFLPFVLYILLLCGMAATIGIYLQRWVVANRWDERFKLLSIYNDWDKYFSGHAIIDDPQSAFDFVQVDVVVGSSEGDMLYTGILAHYSLNKEQGIDRLFMKQVSRRRFVDDVVMGDPSVYSTKEDDERYYNLPGNFLVIPFSQVKNLNIIYLRVQRTEERTAAEPAPSDS